MSNPRFRSSLISRWLYRTITATLWGILLGTNLTAFSAGPGPNGAVFNLPAFSPRTRERSAVPETEPLYPDLLVLPPHNLTLQSLPSKEGGPFLRFGNSIANVGQGPLELRADTGAVRDGFVVTQRVYNSLGKVALEQDIGQFVHHPPHDHWHMEDFVRYEIWSSSPAGLLSAKLVSSGKISYCMTDVRLGRKLPVAGEKAPYPLYVACDNQRQGLSVGWIDTYYFNYPGQTLDVGELTSGVYALRSVVDPDDQVRELEEGNNQAILYFRIDGLDITVLGSKADLSNPGPGFKVLPHPYLSLQ